jgi:DNA replication protein DnaC
MVTHRPQKATPQLLDYPTARRLVWAIMKATLGQRQKAMQVDDNNRPVIVQLIKYFINDPDCELDLQKGILITGGVGSGKTFLLDTMQAFTLAAKLPSRHFRTERCVEVADLIRSQNSSDPKATGRAATKLAHLMHGAWNFDDIGHEPLSVKVWGDDRQVMEPIFTRRYTQFTAGDCITHGTTNLGKQGLRDYCGDRVADRFEEMFNFILLDGPSRRA